MAQDDCEGVVLVGAAAIWAQPGIAALVCLGRGDKGGAAPGAATALAKVTGVIVTARVRLRAAAGCEALPP
eukprot:scaffold10127_cov64-Phaeocystis_antarctica.AAC.6